MKATDSVMPTVRGEASVQPKIQEIATLAPLIAELKAQGKTIVQCHGVFDLLHIGHIRHLQEAKTLGSILIVTITEDQYVNKGPHRPAFTEALRAEALAALQHVDYVAVSRFPTAIDAIGKLKPDIFVKGPDYRNGQNDVTGNITPEQEAVVAVGGRIHFTDEITFSSSYLINRHFETFPTDVEQYLRDLRERYTPRDIIGFLERLHDLKVTVVGEAILDEYIYCEQMGKSAKDPVLAMRYESRELFAGGSLAIANHLAGFVGGVELITYLGTQDSQENFIRSNLKKNVRANFIYKADAPTIVKRRYVESYLRSKHFEIYLFNDEAINSDEEEQLCELLQARIPNTDTVIAADFGHGLLTPKSIRVLCDKSKFLAVNTQINAANIRFHTVSAYDRADYICINEQEVRLDARSRRGKLAHLVNDLAGRLQCSRVLVTRGKSGVVYFADDAEWASPSLTSAVVDRTGSGDAVLAITSLAATIGAPSEVIAFLANVTGAQKVQVVGNRSAIDRVATIKFIEALLK